jgi:hypothetical protein
MSYTGRGARNPQFVALVKFQDPAARRFRRPIEARKKTFPDELKQSHRRRKHPAARPEINLRKRVSHNKIYG